MISALLSVRAMDRGDDVLHQLRKGLWLSDYVNIEDVLMQIKEFTEDITGRIKENASVAQGMQTFLRRYKTLTQSGRFHNGG